MAWENEAKLVEQHLEAMHRLQQEFARALFRVAEEFDREPTDLAMAASNMGHLVFQPLSQVYSERVQRRAADLIRDRREDSTA